MLRTLKRITSLAAAGGIATATVVALSPAAAAVNSTPVNRTIGVTHSCVGLKYALTGAPSAAGPVSARISPDNVAVTYPQEISPGQSFQVLVQPGTMRANADDLGRIKYDIALPTNATVTNVQLVGGGTNLTAKSGSLKVSRVNAAGNPDGNGGFARIWADHTVNNGPNSDTNNPKDGLFVNYNTDFRLPQVRISMTAPTTAGETVSIGLRGAGGAPSTGMAESSMSFGEDVWVSREWSAWPPSAPIDNPSNEDYWCTPGGNAAALTSTRVIGSTTTQFTTTNLQIETGTTDTELTARVTSNAAQPSPVNEGEVEFFVDGVSIGRRPVENGLATMTHTFPPLDDREPVGYQVTARYLGVTNKFDPSSDTATTATVNPGPKAEVTTTATLSAERGRVEDGQLPVELSVDLDTSDGLDLPAGSQVEIRRNGEVIATVPVTGVTAAYADTVPAEVDEPVTYTYTATLLENETYDTIYRASEPSNAVEITVAPEFTPDLTVAADPTSLLVGRSADFTATLTNGGEPLPAGTEVTFRVNGRDVGTATTDATGTAVLSDHEFRTAGEKTVVAHFDGATIDGATYRPVTSSPVTVTVDPLPGVDTRTVIDVTTEVTAGDEVTLTAHVTRADGASLTADGAAELGSVWFFDGADAIGSAPVTIDPATGEARAVFVHRFGETGEHRITAEYSGTRTDDEVLAPSETDAATVVTVRPTDIVIDDPRPEDPPAGGGSLDLGSLTGGAGGGGSLASLSGSGGS